MFNAIVVACWVGVGCLVSLGTSNPYPTTEDCEIEVIRLVDNLVAYEIPMRGLPPPHPDFGFRGLKSCVNQDDLDTILRKLGVEKAEN